jgi:hypothetical protein
LKINSKFRKFFPLIWLKLPQATRPTLSWHQLTPRTAHGPRHHLPGLFGPVVESTPQPCRHRPLVACDLRSHHRPLATDTQAPSVSRWLCLHCDKQCPMPPHRIPPRRLPSLDRSRKDTSTFPIELSLAAHPRHWQLGIMAIGSPATAAHRRFCPHFPSR